VPHTQHRTGSAREPVEMFGGARLHNREQVGGNVRQRTVEKLVEMSRLNGELVEKLVGELVEKLVGELVEKLVENLFANPIRKQAVGGDRSERPGRLRDPVRVLNL
jgi:hypothetical protein